MNKYDEASVRFLQDILDGDESFGINFDRFSYDFKSQKFILIEFQKVDEWNGTQDIRPHTSHPIRYWDKCRNKYAVLWKAVQKLEADFYVINYSESGTEFSDEVRVIQIFSMSYSGIKKWSDWRCSRAEFREWFREMNKRCQGTFAD